MSGQSMQNRIILSSDLGPKSVSELHKTLLAHRGQDLQIDGSEVAQVGGRSLQLLISAQMTWKHDGNSCDLVNASPALSEAFRATGLSNSLSTNSGAAACP